MYSCPTSKLISGFFKILLLFLFTSLLDVINLAVEGSTCIKPKAPSLLFALVLNIDS